MRPLTNLTSTNLYYLIFALLVASLISIFERPTDHRNLHSFPTRRSSDLALQDCAGRAEGCCDRHDAGHTERRMAGLDPDADGLREPPGFPFGRDVLGLDGDGWSRRLRLRRWLWGALTLALEPLHQPLGRDRVSPRLQLGVRWLPVSHDSSASAAAIQASSASSSRSRGAFFSKRANLRSRLTAINSGGVSGCE